MALDCVAVGYVPHSAPLIGPLAPFGIAAYAVFLGLGYSRLKLDREPLPFGLIPFLLHLACIALVCYGNLKASQTTSYLLASRAALVLGLVLLILACIPLSKWLRTLRETHPLWLYASIAGALAWCLRFPFQNLWDSSSSVPGRFLEVLAFRCSHALLQPFLPNVVADPDTFILGTPRFAVRIAESCSGLEGLGLVLVFTVVWLWYFRRESRFPQALLLIPAALVSVWALNIARIAALILIGNAGAGEVAMVGFHSQAGWIAFTAVALGFSMATRRIAWVRRAPAPVGHPSSLPGELTPATPQTGEQAGESPATAAYLVPFLAILAASFVSRSASGYFEWLYPLRFVAGAVAIWWFRSEWITAVNPSTKAGSKRDWRGSALPVFAFRGFALPVVTGALVFAIWIAPTLWTAHSSVVPLEASLAALSPAARYTWLAFRIAAAVITVPIAEELAFRGYLARRITNRDFTAIPYRALTWAGMGVSTVVFGLMHGQQWIVGILAGAAYVLLLKKRGALRDAILAHATSNLLLAVWILARGDYALW